MTKKNWINYLSIKIKKWKNYKKKEKIVLKKR